jgi:dTDP-4-dehydrorhamnose reductase
MRVVILGKNGGVGNALYKFYCKNEFTCIGFGKDELDFLIKETFNNFSLKSNDIIIDCISKIDGEKKNIENVNVKGLTNFINYLNSKNLPYLYIYSSTFSTQICSGVSINPYIKSKIEAERIIQKLVSNYKIVHLIFPFGKGESSSRLISRIINKIKSNESLEIDMLNFNLVPFSKIGLAYETIISKPIKKAIISSDSLITLEEIVLFIYKYLGKKKNYLISGKKKSIVAISTIPIDVSKQDIFNELIQML